MSVIAVPLIFKTCFIHSFAAQHLRITELNCMFSQAGIKPITREHQLPDAAVFLRVVHKLIAGCESVVGAESWKSTRGLILVRM